MFKMTWLPLPRWLYSSAMPADQLPTEITPRNRLLTAAEFHRLADVPPEVEWFANLSNPSTRRAYENAVRDFMRFYRHHQA
jgi:integrase/recombinase XerD